MRFARKPQKHGHFPVPASRGRALSLSAPFNKVHMVPERGSSSGTPQTRDLGLKASRVVRPGAIHPGRIACPYPLPPHAFRPRSRVYGISLVAYDQGAMRILLTVADKAGARPRKTVTGRMAKFDRFLLFSASLERKRWFASEQWPKTAEIDQGSEGQRVCDVDFYISYTSTRSTQYCRTVLFSIQSGRRRC